MGQFLKDILMNKYLTLQLMRSRLRFSFGSFHFFNGVVTVHLLVLQKLSKI